MTKLEDVNQYIQDFKEYKMPFALPEHEDESVRFLDPRVWLNRSCRLITNSCVDAGVRSTTFIPGTIVDLSNGIFNDDNQSLRDAAVTIPKTVAHVVVDAGVVVGVVLGGTVAALGATVAVAGYTFMWGFASAKDAAVSGLYKTAEGIAKVYDS